MATPEENLTKLGLELPDPAPEESNNTRCVRVGNLLYLSAHAPRKGKGTESVYPGVVGRDVTLAQAQEAATLLSACAVYGFSVGNLITFPSLIVQREFPAASFGMLIGLSTGIGQFTYAFGPGLLGLVRDATGGYGAALAMCIALNLIAAAIVLRRPRSTV